MTHFDGMEGRGEREEGIYRLEADVELNFYGDVNFM